MLLSYLIVDNKDYTYIGYWKAGSFLKAREFGLFNQSVFSDWFRTSNDEYRQYSRGRKINQTLKKEFVVDCFYSEGCSHVEKEYLSYYSAVRITVYIETVIDYLLCRCVGLCKYSIQIQAYFFLFVFMYLVARLLIRFFSTETLRITGVLSLVLGLLLSVGMTSTLGIRSILLIMPCFLILHSIWDMWSWIRILMLSVTLVLVGLINYEVVPSAFASYLVLFVCVEHCKGTDLRLLYKKVFLAASILLITLLLALSIHFLLLSVEFNSTGEALRLMSDRFSIRTLGEVGSQNPRIAKASNVSLNVVVKNFWRSSDGFMGFGEATFIGLMFLVLMYNYLRSSSHRFLILLKTVFFASVGLYCCSFLRVLVFKSHAAIPAHGKFLPETFEWFLPFSFIFFIVAILVNDRNTN